MSGVIFLVLLLIELVLSVFFAIADVAKADDPPTDPRSLADTYDGAEWVDDYFSELLQSYNAQWKPYVYWRRQSFSGTYVNVGKDGLRSTVPETTEARNHSESFNIYIFGGSTIWGTGARDAYTIPSLIANRLAADGRNARVTNFGESGYVSTQEILELILQLRNGKRPDLVLFYHGANDTFSAYQQSTPGIPQNEFNRVAEFNLSSRQEVKRRTGALLADIAGALSTTRMLRAIAGGNQKMTPAPEQYDASLPAEVAATYRSNIEIVRTLSQKYGFEYRFYWQPTLFQKQHRTEYEQAELEKMEYIQAFFEDTSDAVQAMSKDPALSSDFRDFSQLFSASPEPIYIDWCHLGEVGNALIAKEILKDLETLLPPGMPTENN